jgi:hypothetical protein
MSFLIIIVLGIKKKTQPCCQKKDTERLAGVFAAVLIDRHTGQRKRAMGSNGNAGDGVHSG